MLTSSIASVAAPPSTNISFRLKDLVGIMSCQHSLEKENIMVKIMDENKMLFSVAFLLLE